MQPATSPAKRFAQIAAIAVGLLPALNLADDAKQGSFPSAAATAEQKIAFFEDMVRPLLVANCYKCHGGGNRNKGGLRLSSRASVLKGGDLGPAVVLDDLEASPLVEAVNYDGLEMPPSGKLPQQQIDILTHWVRIGLPWTPGQEEEDDGHDDAHGPPQVNEQTKQFWSFQPVERPQVPDVGDQQWVAVPIDAFILAKLETAGLHPAPPADRNSLLRRVFYDLIGLPPTPQEVAAFLADDSSDAWERVVDRLLDSPHYGEKWGRHWLDLVRYAESNSYERDDPKPNVWRYRDYVIRSLNDDKPYDQFVSEQLAGDEFESGDSDALIATGYYRLGIWDDEPVDHEQALYDDLDDILATTSQVFLGLTMNCARCHDHKLDPIPQKDYYRMLAFFNGVQRFGIRHPKTVARQSLRSIATDEQQQAQTEAIAAHKQLVEENDLGIAAVEESVRARLTPVEQEDFQDPSSRPAIIEKRIPELLRRKEFRKYKQLLAKRKELKQFQPPALDMALCVTEVGAQPRETHVLVRGNPHAAGDLVEPGFPSVLDPPEPNTSPPSDGESSGRRLALANWLADEHNPLTARVMANRVWQYHFGRGIVRSPSNFGMQGTAPTHPELLDWLASEFVRQGWRLKALHKLILMSNTYRMSSKANPEALAADPENDLLWRFSMRRLTAEEVRDSILAVNGSLNRDKMFGPSIYPIIPQEVLAGQSRPGHNWGQSLPEDRARRSIYIHVKRSLVTPILESFDAADTDGSCPVRFATTQPTQALGMLNSEFANGRARTFAEYLKRAAGDDPAAQVSLCLNRTLQRDPRLDEIRRGTALIAALQQEHEVDAATALASFCLIALNLNEFFYLD